MHDLHDHVKNTHTRIFSKLDKPKYTAAVENDTLVDLFEDHSQIQYSFDSLERYVRLTEDCGMIYEE
jgi:hypothetical protein